MTDLDAALKDWKGFISSPHDDDETAEEIIGILAEAASTLAKLRQDEAEGKVVIWSVGDEPTQEMVTLMATEANRYTGIGVRMNKAFQAAIRAASPTKVLQEEKV